MYKTAFPVQPRQPFSHSHCSFVRCICIFISYVHVHVCTLMWIVSFVCYVVFKIWDDQCPALHSIYMYVWNYHNIRPLFHNNPPYTFIIIVLWCWDVCYSIEWGALQNTGTKSTNWTLEANNQPSIWLVPHTYGRDGCISSNSLVGEGECGE